MKLFNKSLDYFQNFRFLAIKRMVSPAVMEKESLAFWRVNILFTILFSGSVFCIFGIIAAVSLVIKEKAWGFAIFDILGYVICISLLLSRRLRYETRTALTLLLVYAVGLVVIISFGPLSGGPLWLFTFAVLSGVLLGSKAAILAVALNGITLTIISLLLNAEQFGQTFPFFNTWQLMVSTGVNFIVLNLGAAMSVSILVKGLISSNQKEKALFDSLQQERVRLIDAKEKLEIEVEDRKQAEEALQESEEKYRSMMEAMKDPIYICSPDFRVEYMNPAMIRRTGRDATGEHCFKALHALDEKCPWCMHDKAQQGEYNDLEIVSPRDNRSYYISQASVAHEDRSASKLTVFKDVTEMRETEAQLYRAQKMEAMGLLAGGVAHDLNNILSGIISYPELLLMDLPEDSPLRKPIKTIQESGMRAADVVADLLTIARGVATGKETLNLNTIVTEYLESAEYEKLDKTHSFVNFETELDPDLLNMNGSPIHIKKTLMNLVVNASEAIEGRGTVTISSINRYLDEPLKGYESIRTGEYAVLRVSDDGSGITPKDLEKIFEPFYTKKVMGRSGTGLGLAIVWNTVQDHNGYINVESNERGTVFELYFPVTRKKVSDEKEKTPLENYLGQGEKILVVDDEDRQRVIACGILTKLGYTAEAVSSGEEAVEYMKVNAVDLIVLDMVMPKGINGRETYQQIIKIRPGQKAVIASGYAKTKEVDIAQELGAGKYIKKPYTLEKIGVAVKKELGK